MVADHVVAQEHFSPNADLILENRSPAQNPVNLTLCTDSENAKSSPLSIYSTADAQSAMGLYNPVGVSDAKAMLARKIAYTMLVYVGVSNKRTSKAPRRSRGRVASKRTTSPGRRALLRGTSLGR